MHHKFEIHRRIVYAFAGIQTPKHMPKICCSLTNHISTESLIQNYPRVTLTRVFSSLGLEFLGVFNLASVVYHLRPGQLVSDFRFQVSYFRFQIPDSRFQIPDFGFVAASALLRGLALGRGVQMISELRIKNSDFRFQIPVFRFQISDFNFQISDYRFQISDS